MLLRISLCLTCFCISNVNTSSDTTPGSRNSAEQMHSRRQPHNQCLALGNTVSKSPVQKLTCILHPLMVKPQNGYNVLFLNLQSLAEYLAHRHSPFLSRKDVLFSVKVVLTSLDHCNLKMQAWCSEITLGYCQGTR